ncbi:VOC family protein [Micromonospora sp. M51]|uniref:VOC family protein n=1 Tax=Micromonospora TaxID=1873 RepID=UPI001B36B96B|nr:MULTISPECIES: VOC family protein [unclassified Micromonospora]MBQ1012061.1 VOC family protein [Micromonospora sp. M51]MBQ1034361.1 VOC family protein [Micromonospora sp. C97]
MTAHLFAISFDAREPLRLARFWSGLLDREMVEDPQDGVLVLPGADPELRLRFVPWDQPKVVQNRMHFDLTSSSLEDQRQTVARALDLGARHADIGQGPEIDHVVLADPEGNEFDVIAPGNNFLAGCGFVGALACDGSPAVGYFWSRALGWPLVWDEGEETAIQSPNGGTKITWGGPPYMPNGGRDRVRFDLAPAAGVDWQVEVDRLLSLGATRLGTDPDGTGRLALADPDGQEFSLLMPR